MTKVVREWRECLFSFFFPRAPGSRMQRSRSQPQLRYLPIYILLSTVSTVVERIVGAAAPRRIIVAIGSFSESQVRLGALPSSI